MERLTTYKTECNREMICRYEDCDVCEEYCPHLQEDNCLCLQEILKKLGAYEDAEEQGLLHIAPLEDGTPIWYLQDMFGEDYRIRETIYVYNITEYEIGKLGKEFWTTKEEAKQALAKMQKG